MHSLYCFALAPSQQCPSADPWMIPSLCIMDEKCSQIAPINMQNALVLKLLFKRSELLRLRGRGLIEIIEIDF